MKFTLHGVKDNFDLAAHFVFDTRKKPRACRRLKRKVQMTNPEHLKILKQGVVVWNQWRNRNPDSWASKTLYG
jgi:hypothetical protein